MRIPLKFVPIVILGLLTVGCKTSEKEKKSTETIKAIADTLQEKNYSIDTAKTFLQWTAYKYTEKIGVKGTFDEFRLHTKKNASSVEYLLNGSSITIPTLTVNSGAPERDDKLRTYFFKIFKSDTIHGELMTAENGAGEMVLTINTISGTVPYTYRKSNDTLVLSTAINLSNWEGEAAITSLNKECYELHMGADKVSKLWPNVDIIMWLPIKELP